MRKKSKPAREVSLLPRLRVQAGKDVPLGPGKAELLALVAETSSITKAAKKMGMSYMRAWTLIQTMNKHFKEPLIITLRGGEKGGGAELTETGNQVLALYQKMNDDCQRACARSWKKLSSLLRSNTH
jgi:molybdate transport system regulatory protein